MDLSIKDNFRKHITIQYIVSILILMDLSIKVLETSKLAIMALVSFNPYFNRSFY